VEAEIRRALTPLLEKPVRPEEVAEHLLAIAGSDGPAREVREAAPRL
jgi:hypothetical protein